MARNVVHSTARKTPTTRPNSAGRWRPIGAFVGTLLCLTASCGGLDDGGTPATFAARGVGGSGSGGGSGSLANGGAAGFQSGAGSATLPFGSGGTGIGSASSTSRGGSSADLGGTSSSVGTVPTWSSIYAQFFAPGTPGNCSRCHGFGGSADDLYAELQAVGQINGTVSPLAISGASILTWFGGIMPQGGSRTNAEAVASITAWVAAGALND